MYAHTYRLFYSSVSEVVMQSTCILLFISILSSPAVCSSDSAFAVWFYASMQYNVKTKFWIILLKIRLVYCRVC